MRTIIILLAALLTATAAYAHRSDRPDLQNWIMGLHDGHGTTCCDSSEATRLDDPEWQNDNGHYRVFVWGEWTDVPDDAVIEEPNKYGIALVWPWRDNGRPKIRCFLPGAGT